MAFNRALFPSMSEAGVYAMAGAAGVVAGITHTISPCVIIIEITAQANNSLPLLVVTVVSYVVSGEWPTVTQRYCRGKLGMVCAPNSSCR